MDKNVTLIINQDNKTFKIEASKDSNLLQVLRDNEIVTSAPCGGYGSCGKCKVHIKNTGEVLACMTTIESNIEVTLPSTQEVVVLEAQHKYKGYYPLNPGKCVDNVALPYGIAVDIGTTTMVFYLINLVTGENIATQSQLNPQAQFGGDVISRISYATTNNNGIKTMQSLLIEATNKNISNLCKLAAIPKNGIVKIVFTANTTMLHFLAGVDTQSIGTAPHVAKFLDTKQLKAEDLSIDCNPNTVVHLMPSISAFVGSDIVSGLASLNMPETIKNYLFVDIGTNGEMAIVTPKETICCSTAAGPAFEGANISCGMAAQNGAIDKVTLNSYTTIGDSLPTGICGSGLIDLIAVLLEKEIINAEGNMNENFVFSDFNKSENNTNIQLIQNDIREVQLAKSAIISGMLTLVDQASLTLNDIDALVLAGGFGNYIRTESAVRIGLFPKELETKVISVGNAAGTGAQMFLQSEEFASYVEKLKENTTYIELFDIDHFVVEYAKQMAFPAKQK